MGLWDFQDKTLKQAFYYDVIPIYEHPKEKKIAIRSNQ